MSIISFNTQINSYNPLHYNYEVEIYNLSLVANNINYYRREYLWRFRIHRLKRIVLTMYLDIILTHTYVLDKPIYNGYN